MVHAAEGLMQSHLVTMRRSVWIGPGSIGKTVRVDHKGVSVPPSHRISVIPRLRIIERLSAVCPNIAPRMTPLEEFHHFVGSLNKPHERSKNLKHDARITRRLALQHRVIPFFFRSDWRRNARRPAVRKCALHTTELRLPPRRHRRT